MFIGLLSFVRCLEFIYPFSLSSFSQCEPCVIAFSMFSSLGKCYKSSNRTIHTKVHNHLSVSVNGPLQWWSHVFETIRFVSAPSERWVSSTFMSVTHRVHKNRTLLRDPVCGNISTIKHTVSGLIMIWFLFSLFFKDFKIHQAKAVNDA